MHRICAHSRGFYHLTVRKMSEEAFKGISLSEIYGERGPFDLDHLPPVANKRDHIVLYKVPINVSSTHEPQPHRGEQKWDQYHVRMPFASQSEHKSESTSNPSEKVSTPRWDIIQKALLRDFHTTYELEKAIKSYNPKYAREWKFKSLHALFDDDDDTVAESFFREILPFIIRLALQLPEILPGAIPLLKQGQNKSISLSQLQIASLLANAFLCTFPRRNDHKQTSEYASYPSINFSSLFRTPGEQNVEKIKCICNYFRRLNVKIPTGVVTFTRRSINEENFPNWAECTDTFDTTPLHVSDEGTIEDDGDGLLQVDFANKFMGGGVLNYGCVQEEIRFIISPELLISRLFTECLDDNECMVIMGCERFSSYRGYASSFVFAGGIIDKTPHDSSRRRKCTIVAIDAIPFSNRWHQYKENMLKRELNKAFVGFQHDLSTPAPGVATGNWGCGAFGGDKLLKSLLQLMACCVTKRPLVYYTFGDTDLRDDLFSMYEYLTKNKVTVGELYRCLRRFAAESGSGEHLYEFVMACHIEHRDRKSQVNYASSTQPKKSEITASKKPKQITETAEKSSKYEPPNDDGMDYDIEDSDVDDAAADGAADGADHGKDGNDDDDDQFSVEEAMAELNQMRAESKIGPKYKSPPTQTGSTKKSPSSSTHGSQLIRNFFSPIPKPTNSSMSMNSSTSESQEKRPRSSLLVTALEEDHNRKCPKIERAAAQKCDTNFDTTEIQRASPTGGYQTQDHLHDTTTPAQSQSDDLANEQMEVVKLKKKSKSKVSENPFASPDYKETPMDQDGDEAENEKPNSDGDDLNTTKWSEDLCDESMESPKTPESCDVNGDDASNTKNGSVTPSKVNDRPRGHFKYSMPRSTTEQSSPSSLTVHSSTSSEGILTPSGTELGSNIDQQNSDLNSEADQLKALNVTTDK